MFESKALKIKVIFKEYIKQFSKPLYFLEQISKTLPKQSRFLSNYERVIMKSCTI